MNSDRGAIATALYALFQTANYSWKTISRIPLDWERVNASDQPAAFLLKLGETRTKSGYGLGKYLLEYKILCYFRADANPIVPPEDLLNPALTAIDNIFTDPNGAPITLGGLVNDVWIEGTTAIVGGILDPQIVAVIPILVSTGN